MPTSSALIQAICEAVWQADSPVSYRKAIKALYTLDLPHIAHAKEHKRRP